MLEVDAYVMGERDTALLQADNSELVDMTEAVAESWRLDHPAKSRSRSFPLSAPSRYVHT